MDTARHRPLASSPPVAGCVPLHEAGDFPVGGKAAGLARLLALGLRVPRGFVIIDAARCDPREIEAAYERLGGGAVAVRSSAIGEDGETTSFAGQYETVLDVEGAAEVLDAVRRCVTARDSRRVASYLEHHDREAAPMNVVVQRMAPCRASGVLFTADPVTGRRDCLVVDAVAGQGEALVSGAVTPDHYLLSRAGEVRRAELSGEEPLLSEAELEALARDALRVEARFGLPVDLEWAVDAAGDVHWLQARPITALPADPDELGTFQDETDHYTSCNIGECMPGAVTPLSWSTVWRGNDWALQNLQRGMGVHDEPLGDYRLSRLYYGRLFLNLTKIAASSTHVAGASNESLGLAICGRVVPDLDPGPPAPPWIRAANGLHYLRYLLGGPRRERLLEDLCDTLRFPDADDPRDLWREIDRRLHVLILAFDHHMVSSAGSGALEPALMGVLAKGEPPTAETQALVAALLAEASDHDVESADIVAGVDRIVEAALADPDAVAGLTSGSVEDALRWLNSGEAGEAGRRFEEYLEAHGHRCVRELELAEPPWSEDPLPLAASIRAAVVARTATRAHERPAPPAAEVPRLAAPLRWLVGLTQRAVRRRERTKSLLVLVVSRFKKAYRRLATLMVDRGILPDAELVFFLTHEELGRLLSGEAPDLVGRAEGRRAAQAYQREVSFPDVFRGHPEPDRPTATAEGGARSLAGTPVSRGRVTAPARVATTLEEAAALQAGEILVTPITDVGWSPYFGIISGLATDVGSSVSHGAVVAREYAIPAVVNLRHATRLFETGDLVTLDGDRGTLELANS